MSVNVVVVLDRDHNAALNILSLGLSTVGHTGSQALGEDTALLAGEAAWSWGFPP
jgi:putative transposase